MVHKEGTRDHELPTFAGGKMGPDVPDKLCTICGYTNPNISHYAYVQADQIATLVDLDFQTAMPHMENVSDHLASTTPCQFMCYKWENYDHPERNGPSCKFKKLALRCLKS